MNEEQLCIKDGGWYLNGVCYANNYDEMQNLGNSFTYNSEFDNKTNNINILYFLPLIILGIVLIYIFYLICIEIKARYYLNVKKRVQELESKQKK